MSYKFEPNDVVSGSFGKLYLAGKEIAELLDFESKLKLESKDVIVRGQKGKKNVGSSIELKIKLQKVFSTELEALKSVIKNRLNNYYTINVMIDDPDALGAEAIAFNNALLTGDLDIGSFKPQELLEREFTFSVLPSDVDVLETIEDI